MRSRGAGTLRADGRWQTVVTITATDGRKKRVTLYAPSQRDLEDVRIRFLMDHGRALAPDVTVARLADLWREDAERRLRASTWTQYDPALKRIHARFGRMAVRDLTAALVAGWLRQLDKEGVGARSVQVARNVLAGVLDHGRETGLLTENVARGVRLPSSPTRAMRKRPRLGPRELGRILAAEESDVLRDLWETLAATGLRISEALAATRADLEWRMDLWWIVVRESKTAAGVREVPLPDAIGHRLSGRAGALFPTRDPETPILYRNALRSWRATLARAEVPYTNIHQLRKHAISRWFAAGLDDGVVKALAGHTDISVARNVYERLGRDRIADAVFDPRYVAGVSGASSGPDPLGME